MAKRSDELYALLDELARLTVLDEGSPQSFRARAYENARLALRSAPGDLEQMGEAELQRLDGVGKATAKKVREYFDTGRIQKLEELREQYPPAYQQLAKIPGLGPKTLSRLRSELGVESVDDLRAAIAAKSLRELKGLGAKAEAKILSAIDRLGMSGKDRRTPIAEVLPVAQRLVQELASLPQVKRAAYCGSLRRLSPTIGDVDILVAATEPRPVMKHFLALPLVRQSSGGGDTRTSILTDRGLQVDLRVVEAHQFGAAQLYFTGSKAHNIKLRQLAIKKGWTLNEYGLLGADDGKIIASESEEEIYEALGLHWIPAPMREDLGEIEASAAGVLPALLAVEDLRGDLHVHTDLSGDGRSSLDDVLANASKRNYQYLAITDHAEDLAINGVGRADLLAQRSGLRSRQGKLSDMRLLHGVELNIGREGGLDYDTPFRDGFDWCVAAVHSHFDLSREQQTKRILRAMDEPAVNVIGHLSGRMIGRRPGIELDVDAILQHAAATGTALEINSALPRLDASWEVLRKARNLEVTFVVSTDAHHVDELERTRWGVQQAQRGWVARDRIANTWSEERFRDFAARKRQNA